MNNQSLDRQICSKCVMDISDSEISFDEDGVCNHCHQAEVSLARVQLTPDESQQKVDQLVDRIRKGSTDRKYDVVVGMSGGVDSSYVALLAYKLGLRVLAVHFDNGWNAEVAVKNIKTLVDSFGFDLETCVINWFEFKDLQRSFIRAGVVDIEMLSDHAIMASMFDLAKRHNVRYILSGTNIATEHGMPRTWVWNKNDLTNIEDIHRRYGEIKLKSFPRMGLLKSLVRRKLHMGFEFVEILNLINFRKDAAMKVLSEETGWKYYGGKHYESIFTKFYQAYILPVKFGVDKRKVHLSALIRNAEITRAQALLKLQEPLYSEVDLRRDRAYVLKKLNLSQNEFDDIISAAPVPHSYYRTDQNIRLLIKAIAAKLGL